ncbi:MAG: hypothetical protein WCF92_03085 [bacterium]
MKNKLQNIFLVISSLLFAFPAFAQTNNCGSGTPQGFHDLLTCYIAYKIEHYIPFLIMIAFVLFLIGVVRFVGAGDNEEARQAGRSVMIFGIVVLFVMVSVWGLVAILYSSFFTGTVTLPTQLPALITN